MTVELFVDILTILICILQSVGYTSNALIKGSQNNSDLDSDDADPNHEHLLALINWQYWVLSGVSLVLFTTVFLIWKLTKALPKESLKTSRNSIVISWRRLLRFEKARG